MIFYIGLKTERGNESITDYVLVCSCAIACVGSFPFNYRIKLASPSMQGRNSAVLIKPSSK